jgi:hypothetical protein
VFVTVLGEHERCVDDTDVRKRLREMPLSRTCLGVYLLSEEAHVVRVREEVFERLCGTFHVATAGLALYSPEAADAEGAFTRRESVVGPCLVAVD